MIKVIENVLSEKDLEAIKNILSNKDLDWYISKDIDFRFFESKALTNKNSVSTYQITHSIFNNKKLTNKNYKFIYYLIKNIFEQNNCHGKITRIKVNILFNHFEMNENKYNIPHSDCNKDHCNIVLYLNESDGDTIFFNEYYDKNLNNLTIKQRVSPKVNRAVISDGLMHTSSNPTKNEIRIVLNAVLEKSINKLNEEL